MSRRIPLWLTLVPLALAVGLYLLLWQGWARDFDSEVHDWLPATPFEVTGFPYRLEALISHPELQGGAVVRLFASALRARINRGPWQEDLTLVGADYPRFSAIVGPGIGASFSGKSALTSIKVENGRLQRLSSVIEAANARLGFSPVTIAADSLELHLRERLPDARTPEAATPPPRGQLVISGQRVRFDRGDALTLAADMAVTGPDRLTAYDRWATTGTIELTRASLSDAHGEIAGIRATIVPIGRRALRFAGTIDTICPATISAAFAGKTAAPEQRLRTALRLAFEGEPGTMRLAALPNDLGQRAVRGQLPACPVIRKLQ